MITIIISMITSAAVTAFIYWALHRANPDVAQEATDSLLEQAKKDAEAVEQAAKDKLHIG